MYSALKFSVHINDFKAVTDRVAVAENKGCFEDVKFHTAYQGEKEEGNRTCFILKN